MNRNAAIEFDRFRDFDAYWKADPVGAAWWILQVAGSAEAESAALQPLRELFPTHPAPEKEPEIAASLQHQAGVLLPMGKVLSAAIGSLAPVDVDLIGWKLPARLWPPVLTGQARVEPADEPARSVTREIRALSIRQPLQRVITFESGNFKRVLACPFDPLESIGADLSAFEGAYNVSVRGWPTSNGRLFVQEAAPVMTHPGLGPGDFASGRLFTDSEKDSPVRLRVNAEQVISIDDAAIQEQLRPFVGTGVMLYGRRTLDRATGSITLTDVRSDLWLLCRLTDPADDERKIPQAPLPTIQGRTAMCIGATPPWNWAGPNVRTHLLAPVHAASLMRTTERRFLYGSAIPSLPVGLTSPIPEVKRVFLASAVTDRDTDSEAHIATRLVPPGTVVTDLSAIAALVSAEAISR